MEQGTEIRLTYKLTADGSALMEEFQAGKDVMVNHVYRGRAPHNRHALL
jgi:hypothetical protein